MSKKNNWIWATGIENTFIPQTAKGERILDEFEITQHYLNWQEDLESIRKSGVSMVRYGIPWYKVEPEMGNFDWSWVDQVMAYFDNHRELVPVIDLMHYGTPLWLKNEFMNANYPELIARYASAFAKRYKRIIKYYTPLNEPYINSEWCGHSGTWPPYLKGFLGFSLIMNQLCKGIILTVRSLKEVQPEAIMVHVEASIKYVFSKELDNETISFWNEFRYLMWELVQGKISNGHMLYQWVIDNHISHSDLKWYEQNKIDLDIIGINYYPQFSVRMITENVIENEQVPNSVVGSASDLKDIVRDIYIRYKRPVFITETSFRGSVEERTEWLLKAVNACNEMIEEGIELYGFTWFPFFDMVDWPFRTNGLSFNENLATFGLYNLKEMPDGKIIRTKNTTAECFEEEIKIGSK